MLLFIGVEDGSVYRVFFLEVPGSVDLSVIAHKIPGSAALFTGAFPSVFPRVIYVLSVRFSVGSVIYFLK